MYVRVCCEACVLMIVDNGIRSSLTFRCIQTRKKKQMKKQWVEQ